MKRIQPPAMRPEEAALLQSIADHIDEDTPRLVLADWLEENDQANRAWFIRRQIESADQHCKYDDIPTWSRSYPGTVDNPKSIDRLILFGPWDDMLKDSHYRDSELLERLPGPSLMNCCGVRWCGANDRRDRRERSTYWHRGFPWLIRSFCLDEIVRFAFSQANASAPSLSQPTNNGESTGWPAVRLSRYTMIFESEEGNTLINKVYVSSHLYTTHDKSDYQGVPVELERWLKYDTANLDSRTLPENCKSVYGWKSPTGALIALNYAIRMMLKRGGELYRKMVIEGYGDPSGAAWHAYNTESKPDLPDTSGED